ncbi:MAG: serine--tRNA ligase, partial [Endomicrobium sp.]|nr:serine--tRNA ligase [Endomicrobium sp.]
MIDIKLIRNNLNKIKQILSDRNMDINLNELLNLDLYRKKLLKKIESLQIVKNQISKNMVHQSILSKDDMMKCKRIKQQIKYYKNKLITVNSDIKSLMLEIPNIPDKSVPIGEGRKNNKVVKLVNIPKKFSFVPKSHWELGENLDILDFKTASKISGSRFVILKNEGAILERALISFFIDVHRQHGYKEIIAPYLVNKVSMTGTGQLPKFKDEVFNCPKDELFLIPTSEVSITNIYSNKILDIYDLPQKYVSFSACFRREAGSYGKDTKGLIRNHQFNKVELVKFVDPIKSNIELETLLLDVEYILKLLNLPYRIVLLCTGDLGFTSSKTYDVEAWFSYDNSYKEISSCSNFKDFQSRRMNIQLQYNTKHKVFVHTLNGSGLAVGRTFAAILEYYQQMDGSIRIPEVLHKYTGFS